METITPETPDNADSKSTVDASRPFHSVKEAVAIFGKRIFVGEIQSPLKSPGSAIGKVTSPSYQGAPSLEKPPSIVIGKVNSPTLSEFTPSPIKASRSAIGKVTSPTSSEFTPSPEKPSSFLAEKGISPSSEFTPSPSSGIGLIESPTYELNISPDKPSSCVVEKVTSTTHELTPGLEKSTSSANDKVQSHSLSENSQSFGVENGIPDSSEFAQSSNKQYLSNVKKETAISSVNEPTTPSPQNPKTQNKNYPSPSFSWEKGISAPPTPSNWRKEIEPTPSPENLKDDKHGKIVHGNDLVMMLMILKRLESELQETKMELKLLKERESETEVALASLNAELHKNMSKIAKAEAAEAAIAAAKSTTLVDEGNKKTRSRSRDSEEGSRSEVMVKAVDSPTLAQILSITDYDCYFEDDKKLKQKMKKKPIIPLVTDIIPWRKKSPHASNYHPAPLFSWQ